MRVLRIKYDKEIVTFTCDSIAYIEYNGQRDFIIKSANGLTITNVLYPTTMEIEQCADIYLKLCEYVFYGQLKYGENYIITLNSHDVDINVMKTNNVLQTNLKES